MNPKIIYARGSALGPRGEESVKGGYDMTAFWCRAGTAATITPLGIDGMIKPPGPAYGDTISGTNLAGGIAAALLKRERTGEPSVVDVSLLGSGLWAMGHTVALTKHLDQRWKRRRPACTARRSIRWSGVYATSDGRYISFVMMQPTKFWADVCRHIDRPELADDPRFATAEQIAAQHSGGGGDLDQGHRDPHACRVERTLRDARRAVGAGAGHVAGGRRRADPGERICGARRRTRAGRQPGAVRRHRTADRAGTRIRRADRRDLAGTRAATGTASSNSRPPAPSLRFQEPECPSMLSTHLLVRTVRRSGCVGKVGR